MTSSELQLVHLSDLHIGLASGTGEGSWGTAVERLRTARGRIWGLEQADADNLERLAESAARDKVAKRPGGQVHCIASGDLTAQGGKREFGRAFDYLRKTLSTPKAGLAYGEVGGYSHVLGNHDVWRSDLDRATRKGFRRTEEVREIVRKRGGPLASGPGRSVSRRSRPPPCSRLPTRVVAAQPPQRLCLRPRVEQPTRTAREGRQRGQRQGQEGRGPCVPPDRGPTSSGQAQAQRLAGLGAVRLPPVECQGR